MRVTSIGHAGFFIETELGSVLCDPWFEPAFFGSWFVFPRNDGLPEDLQARMETPSFLYISHLHGDHLDETWLADHVDRSTTVLLPDYPTDELEQHLRRFGFSSFVHTEDGKPVEVAGGLKITIHVQTALSDGPGGDSAIVVDDGRLRVLNQNDCRLASLNAVTANGPIDIHCLQYSGAIWYPMVYELPADELRRLRDAKVEAQLSRAVSYVKGIDATYVVPCAGPPAFLDPALFGVNWITGDEISIFPDFPIFLKRLESDGVHGGKMLIPGSALIVDERGGEPRVEHPVSEAEVQRPFVDKLAYLREYQADWTPWLEAHRASWPKPTDGLLADLQSWWNPLLAAAPRTRAAIGAGCLMRLHDDDPAHALLEIYIDFPNGEVRPYAGEEYGFRYDIPRRLVEKVVADRAVDWSNALFLSCRFTAWRAGGYNEFIFNFFKSLSFERMARAEEQVKIDLHDEPVSEQEDIRIGDWVVQRLCPHRQADLAQFGELSQDSCTLTCTLHGWQFDLASGKALTTDDRTIRARRAD